MATYYYRDSISSFLGSSEDTIIGRLISSDPGESVQMTQVFAWKGQISILKDIMGPFDGHVFFEYTIPRMGRRIDVVLIINHVLFVLEFKVGESEFLNSAIDQVWDYALNLKNFHEGNHDLTIAPIIIATEADHSDTTIEFDLHEDSVYVPIRANKHTLLNIMRILLEQPETTVIEPNHWTNGRYAPTPTIIEAAMALYNNHSVADITRSEATATNGQQPFLQMTDPVTGGRGLRGSLRSALQQSQQQPGDRVFAY